MMGFGVFPPETRGWVLGVSGAGLGGVLLSVSNSLPPDLTRVRFAGKRFDLDAPASRGDNPPGPFGAGSFSGVVGSTGAVRSRIRSRPPPLPSFLLPNLPLLGLPVGEDG